MPMVAQQAVAELEALTVQHPEAKAFQDAASGGYPVAWIDERPSVGFLGQLAPDVDVDAWFAWADAHPEVQAGTCRYGIASFRLDAFHLGLLEAVL